MPLRFTLPYREQRLVSITRDRVHVVVLARESSGEEAARFRFIHGGGEREHFSLRGVALLALTHDGTEAARHEDMLVHRVVGATGIFWHGPPRPGIMPPESGAHAWDIPSGGKLWSFAGGLVGLDGGVALGRTGEKAQAADFWFRYAIVDIATGARRAELDGKRLVSVNADSEHAYVMEWSGAVSAYRLADGKRLWTTTQPDLSATATSFGLALGDGCVWYATNDGVVGVDRFTGAAVVKHAMKEYFGDVLTTERGAVTVRETKIDLVTRSAATRISDVVMGERTAMTNGRWIVARAKDRGDARTKDLVVITPDGTVSFLKLTEPAVAVVLGEEHVALQIDGAFVVVSLEELADPKQKTLTFPDGSTFGKRASLPKPTASSAATRLADALTAAGVMPAMEKSERALLLIELFGRDEIPTSGAAQLLQAVSNDDALDRGFIAHDWRFGQETSDVVAEFDRALGGGGVRLAQTRNDATGLAMRMTYGGEVEEVTFPNSVSLADVARRIDAFLAKAASPKRIYELESDGDGFAFLVVEKAVIARLRDAKVKGVSGKPLAAA
jgi:hypothetical protein